MDPYKVLGVSRTATQDEIKAAYRTLVKKYHPDKYTDDVMKAKAEEKIKEINEAYDMLTKGNGQGAYSNADRGYSGSYSGEYASEFSRVEMCINSGRLDEAEAMMSAIPLHNARWYYLMGLIDTQRGRYSSAARNFEQSYRREPDNPEYRSVYEQTHMNADSYRRRYSYNDDSYDSDGCGSCCETIMCIYCTNTICNICLRGCC